MGNQCCAAPENVTDGGDLPKSVKKITMDDIQNMEYKYPFYRMDARKMFTRIYEIKGEEIPEKGEMITFKDL